jgi:methyltransferase-like protein
LDFSVQDEDNLEQAGAIENSEPKQGETRNADENSSVIELMREFIATEEKAGPKINNDLASVVNNGLRKRANEDKLKELSKNIPSQKMSLV